MAGPRVEHVAFARREQPVARRQLCQGGEEEGGALLAGPRQRGARRPHIDGLVDDRLDSPDPSATGEAILMIENYRA
jgi:hypothetical protein